MVRPRTGSGASEDLEPIQGLTAGVAASQPTETIREKDDVSQIFDSKVELMIGNGCGRMGIWG
jgi:hypothetical protein